MENGIENVASDVVVGMQIGPVYRLQIGNIPNNPGIDLYPTIEVVDRLYPPPCLELRYPIPVEFTENELELAARGAFVTRIVYVEDPSQALPIAYKADAEQTWAEAPKGEDPLVEADRRGRPVAIVRIGSRVPGSGSINGGLIPPAVLYDPLVVAQARERNCEDCVCQCAGCNPLDPYGPLIGPSDEYLCDGGDFGSPAGVRADWTIDGLDEEDAISHYDTLDGRVIVEPSNRVCIYAPRFAAIRRLVQPLVNEQPVFVNQAIDDERPVRADESQPVASSLQRHAPVIDIGQRPPSLFRQRQQAGGLENLQASTDAFLSIGPYNVVEILRTGEVVGVEKALVEKLSQAAITLTGVQAPQVLINVKQAHAAVNVQ
jgi:hypothetical protein